MPKRIFASVPPINTDPLPWWQYGGNSSDTCSAEQGDPRWGRVYMPNPEFDKPRAHSANPLLVAFREELAYFPIETTTRREMLEGWRNLLVHGPSNNADRELEMELHVLLGNPPGPGWEDSWLDWSQACIAHATAVLDRIIRLA